MKRLSLSSYFLVLLCFILFGIGSISCKDGNQKILPITQKKSTLSTAFSEDFYIGAALSARVIRKEDTLAVETLKREFSAISPENDMKWMLIHPEEDRFNFETADAYVDLGLKNNMHILGHTLVWHSQLADYVNQLKDSTSLANHLKDHITTIVSRYKGKIDAWDVVNEALNEDGTLRQTIFLEVLGESYLENAFKWTSQIDPMAQLIYNDYNLCNPEKRAGVVKLVKQLQSKNIKIDAVGMQGHWNLKEPTLTEIENSILAYHDLGVKVLVTELDITVLPNPWDLQGAEISQNFEGSPFMNPYPDQLPDSVQVQLAKRYQDIFQLFLKHRDKIDRVTFWGIHDGSSWLNGWPIRGRTNYPLLFDRSYRPKMAYDSIMALKD
ncbi:endo-1,4-beta-xylanase [Arenibacter sp. GZD96]|uniref:endo-1,4-beta-xylanase n=1 Tax=Aurantibrevibacter litoralis TaxID=3106030 RepID=UPI002AFF257E|nr:endo-1,4-beta-xylanase [Arenibacter sp. GZD-96]MEA1786220.1 endo-1,4-beta-xylanase [Arenibacter sp. GZD-96]